MKSTSSYRIALALACAFVLGLFAVSGLGLAAFAAQDALPGNALLSIKNSLGDARLDFAGKAMQIDRLESGSPGAVHPGFQKSMAAAGLQTSVDRRLAGDGSESYGTVEAMTDTAWVIDGVSYTITAMTKIEGDIQVGDVVEFYAAPAADGSMTLLKVEPSGDGGETGDDMEDDPEDDHEMSGTVEAISDTSITIDGVTYALDAGTKIEGSLQVGDMVEFHVATAADGSLVLTKIERKDDSSGEEMDDDDDSHGDGEYRDDDDDDHEDGDSSGTTPPSYDHDDDDDHDGEHDGHHGDDDHEEDHDGDHGGDHGDHDD